MEELIKELTQLLDQFAQQEIGNRLSDFAMISLKNLTLEKVHKYKITKISQEGKTKS